MQNYKNQNFKIPQESSDYKDASNFVIKSIEEIIEKAIKNGEK